MKNTLLVLLLMPLWGLLKAQTNIVTYAGNSGKETFYDVLQLTDGTFLVSGYADDLNWVNPNVPTIQLSYTGSIPNAQGSNRYGFLLHLSADMQAILHLVHFPKGAVEDIRFIKTDTQPYTPTGHLYISCNTADTDNNNGGYIIAKLDNNFVEGLPSGLLWHTAVWAKSGPKDYHPWDVTNDGRVYYISGEAHSYDWSAVYCLDNQGRRTVVNHWRTHWLANGAEWRGAPASTNPLGSIDSVKFSAIVLKVWGRCELRSWNDEDFEAVLPDGNGGVKKGTWPADFFFNGPCDPAEPTANGPGYNGYSAQSCCPVWGGSCIAVDKRNNHLYIGMNMKSYYNPESTPDFEPAVIAMDNTGELLWWSRLYHEITPAGDTVGSIPDQYVDALAIDYNSQQLAVGARAHGNNVENLWEGNTIAANPAAFGFQNQFTGSNGNIHISWLGKLRLDDGQLMHSTYIAELAEGTDGLGAPHPDANLDGWPNPNTGWPDVNTTRLAKNNMKVSSNGDVCILGVGRRTITTANAYQKMVKPFYGGKSCWNSFVRVYDANLHTPKYSSLVVGVWDTLSQAGGDNTELFGLYKTSLGVVCVGRHTADAAGLPKGNNLPVINATPWGNTSPQNESAVLVYYQAENLQNDGDNIATALTEPETGNPDITVYPNPATHELFVAFNDPNQHTANWKYQVTDLLGRRITAGNLLDQAIDTHAIPRGMYLLQVFHDKKCFTKKIIIQ